MVELRKMSGKSEKLNVHIVLCYAYSNAITENENGKRMNETKPTITTANGIRTAHHNSKKRPS